MAIRVIWDIHCPHCGAKGLRCKLDKRTPAFDYWLCWSCEKYFELARPAFYEEVSDD